MRFTAHPKHNRQVLLKVNDNNFFLEKLDLKTIIDDESIEASICRRVRKIESHLFDEYESELLTYQ